MRFKGVSLAAAAVLSVTAVAGAVLPAASADAATTVTFKLCNLEGNVTTTYGCAEAHGNDAEVTIQSTSDTSLTNFEQVAVGNDGCIASASGISMCPATPFLLEQPTTGECLEYDATDSATVVRMQACDSSKASQQWYTLDNGPIAVQLQNGQATTAADGTHECLEGTEVDGFGAGLSISPCTDLYAGENWVAEIN
jgi:hypothetical protein